MGGSQSQSKKAAGTHSSAKNSSRQNSDSEGQFGTPEVQTPIHVSLKEPVVLEDYNANGTAGLPEDDSQLISGAGELHEILDQNSNRNEVQPASSLSNAPGKDINEQEESFDALNNLTDAHEPKMLRPLSLKLTGDAVVMSEGVKEAHQGQLCNGQTDSEPVAIHEKVEPPPSTVREVLNQANLSKAEVTSDDDIEILVPKVSYGFDPDRYDDNFNPFLSGGSRLRNSPPLCPPAVTTKDPTTIPQYSPTWEDPVTTQERSTSMQKYLAAARDNPSAVWEDPNAVQEDPTNLMEVPVNMCECPISPQDSTATRENSSTSQENPTATQEFPSMTQEDSATTWESTNSIKANLISAQEDPTVNHKDSTTAHEDLITTREDPIGAREDPLSSQENLVSASEDPTTGEAKPIKLEFGLTEEGVGRETKRPAPRKLGKKPGSKLLAPRKLRTKAAETAPALTAAQTAPALTAAQTAPALTAAQTAPALTAAQSSEQAAVAKSSYSSNPSDWDDPNFNPFGSKAKMSNSPTLTKGSNNFNPEEFDETQDPFKPSKTIAEDSISKVASPEGKLADEPAKHKLELPLEDEQRKGRQSPRKTKSRIITNACKVEKYEDQSLVLDVCDQEGAVVTTAPSASQRVSRATDEEKLASTVKGESENDLSPSPALKSTRPRSFEPQMKTENSLELKDSCVLSKEQPDPQTTELTTGSEGPVKESPLLSSVSISEADKAAVLALIREEIIAKEMEAGQWKRKYDQSRDEVGEMRMIVAEYEKTVAQMIEDEQRTSQTSQRSIQQLTAERDQALADLNSVERSLSDLFRRYENMKTVLEGFKKNEEVLKKCAQEYLLRVKQEEQRYQALKLHAEEKLNSANEEIALVRSKASSEGIALNASLRKEQMRVESLEQALHQKNQEVEELTKICDELIAKLG
ncbi:hypothetical protein GJAV_G00036830 [Gymnothorax javanicus]|nr:hypothetical protein GJAV_G00036830 [Gymnothorax javanicus]